MTTRDWIRMALYLAVALVLSYVESLFPLPVGVPGIKLGLANIVTVVALVTLGWKKTFWITLLRCLFTAMFGVFSTLLFSLAGGLLSLVVMTLLFGTDRFSLTAVSAAGGVCHNVGQIAVAALVMGPGILAYLPWLMAAGLISGLAVGLAAGLVARRLKSQSEKGVEE